MRSLSSSRCVRSAGFTLVELLVVIAIIGILAAAAFPVIVGVINQAKRVKSTTMASQIQTAINSYYTEYQTYPNPAGVAMDVLFDGKAPDANYNKVFYGLYGNFSPTAPNTVINTGINTRAIQYLSINKADMDANGIIKQPFTNAGMQYYSIALDTDYSGTLNNGNNIAIPDFTKTGTAFKSSLTSMANVLTTPTAIWCSNDENPATSTVPNHWSHTY